MRTVAILTATALLAGRLPAAEKGTIPAREVTAPVFTFDKMPGSLAELDLPLILQEVAGVERRGEICSSGVPLPCGLLKEPEGIAVFDPAGRPVPAQFRVLERWHEGGIGKADLSVKWLLVTFLADVPAGKAAVYRLRAGKNPAPASAVTIEKKGEGYVLNGLEMKPDFSAPFRVVLTDGDGSQIPASELPFTWEIWEQGPVRSCLKAESPTVPGKFGLTAYVYAYAPSTPSTSSGQASSGQAGMKRWDLTIVLRNTPPEMHGPLYFRSFSVTWEPPEIKRAVDCVFGGEPGRHFPGRAEDGKPACLRQASDGTDAWDKLTSMPGTSKRRWDLAFVVDWATRGMSKLGAPEFRGYRLFSGGRETGAGNYSQGWLTLHGDGAGAFACVREFLRNYPKALEAGPGSAVVHLWPEWKGHDGLHWLDDCTWKDHDISFVLAAGPIPTAEAEARSRAFDCPLVAFCGVDWYRKTGVFGEYFSRRWKEAPVAVSKGLAAVADHRNWLTSGTNLERNRRRYYGSCQIEPFAKTGNVHHAYQLRRTFRHDGLTPFWVDDYQYPRDRKALRVPIPYMRPPREVGTYRPNTAHHGYAAWNNQHFLCDEMFDGWRLFGDPLALEEVRKVGVYYRHYVEYRKNGGKIGETRFDALPMENLCDAWRITGDEGLRRSLDDFAEVAWETVNKERGYYWVSSYKVKIGGKDQNARVEATRMLSDLLNGLREYYKLTGDERTADLMLGIVDYQLAESFIKWPDGFLYKIPVDPQQNAAVRAAGKKGGPGQEWETFPGLSWAYLYTGEQRYKQVFDEGIKISKPEGSLLDADGWGMGWRPECDIVRELPRTDTEPPAAVTDLAAEALGGGRVKLTWTAPAGEPARYQVKWAERPMIERLKWPEEKDVKANWWAAENVAGEPAPSAGKQEMTVEGVSPGKRFFAVRSFDATSNRSAIGKVAEVEVK
jgi:hypothetical protein